MKITKNQLQEIIKKEVLKQKTLIELKKKKGSILKELYEMDYSMEDEDFIDEEDDFLEETSLFSNEELASIEGQVAGGEQPVQDTLEEGKVTDFFKKFTIEGLQNKLKGYVQQLITKYNLTELPAELQPYMGKSFEETKQMVKGQMPALAEGTLNEGMDKNDFLILVNKVAGTLTGAGVFGTIVCGISQQVAGMMGNFGMLRFLEGSLTTVIISTIVAFAIWMVSTVVQMSVEQQR